MLLINYARCGQSYAKDVSETDVSREDLLASVARCRAASDIEDVDMNPLDNRIYFNLKLVEDLLSYDRDDIYCLLSGEVGLFFLGPKEMYAKVVGAIKAQQRYGFSLPETLD